MAVPLPSSGTQELKEIQELMGRRDPSPPPHSLHRRPSYSRQTKIDSDTIFANELACTENLSSEAISAAKRSLHGPHSATWHPRSRNVTSAGSSLATLGRPPAASAAPRCTPSPPSSSLTGSAKEWAAGRISSSSGGAQESPTEGNFRPLDGQVSPGSNNVWPQTARVPSRPHESISPVRLPASRLSSSADLTKSIISPRRSSTSSIHESTASRPESRENSRSPLTRRMSTSSLRSPPPLFLSSESPVQVSTGSSTRTKIMSDYTSDSQESPTARTFRPLDGQVTPGSNNVWPQTARAPSRPHESVSPVRLPTSRLSSSADLKKITEPADSSSVLMSHKATKSIISPRRSSTSSIHESTASRPESRENSRSPLTRRMSTSSLRSPPPLFLFSESPMQVSTGSSTRTKIMSDYTSDSQEKHTEPADASSALMSHKANEGNSERQEISPLRTTRAQEMRAEKGKLVKYLGTSGTRKDSLFSYSEQECRRKVQRHEREKLQDEDGEGKITIVRSCDGGQPRFIKCPSSDKDGQELSTVLCMGSWVGAYTVMRRLHTMPTSQQEICLGYCDNKQDNHLHHLARGGGDFLDDDRWSNDAIIMATIAIILQQFDPQMMHAHNCHGQTALDCCTGSALTDFFESIQHMPKLEEGTNRLDYAIQARKKIEEVRKLALEERERESEGRVMFELSRKKFE